VKKRRYRFPAPAPWFPSEFGKNSLHGFLLTLSLVPGVILLSVLEMQTIIVGLVCLLVVAVSLHVVSALNQAAERRAEEKLSDDDTEQPHP